MKSPRPIFVILGLLIAGFALIGYLRGPKVSSGLSVTLKAGGKTVIANAQQAVNQKNEGDAITVTLDKKHVVVVTPDSISVNGESRPFTARVIRIRSLKDGTLKIEPSNE